MHKASSAGAAISHAALMKCQCRCACVHVNYLGSSASVFCRYIWGRGAQDVKITVFALLEAVTNLLDQGWGLTSISFYKL